MNKELRNLKVEFIHSGDVGKTFKFASGSAYRVTSTGAIVNTTPKQFRNKKERVAFRRVMKQLESKPNEQTNIP